MKLLYFILLCAFSFLYTMSCYLPPTTTEQLASAPVSDDEDDDKDDDRDDRRMCWNRDSCQDSCDRIFEKQSSRYECSELTYKEVNTLAEVSDLLNVKEDTTSDSPTEGELVIASISSSDLEDIDSDDFVLYLQVGFSSFVDIVERMGTPDSQAGVASEAGGADDVKTFMKWVAENEDIAEVISSYDEGYELGHELFIKMAGSEIQLSSGNESFNLRVDGGDATSDPTHIYFAGSNEEARIGGSHLFDIDTDEFEIQQIAQFIAGFIENSVDSNESFLDLADYEDNESALEWGHQTLVSFCESTSSGHVNQCLQGVYCAHRARTSTSNKYNVIHRSSSTLGDVSIDSDGIFRRMDDRDDIFGRTDVEFCNSEDIQDEDLLDRYFQ